MWTLGSILKTSVVAGLIAGAAISGFHTLLIEPVIERAIALEEQHSQTHGGSEAEPVVDRPTQRWGLVLGFILYGAIWGLLLGLLLYLIQGWRPTTWTVVKYGFVLAVLLGWSVALFPFLKYPANPPGVGETETVGYRQALYLAFIGLSVIGTALAVGLSRLLSRPAWAPAQGRVRWLAAAAFYVIYAVAIYAVLPANPDPIEMPRDLVWTFRVISFVGLMLFWLILAGMFGWFARDTSPVLASH
ncbi:MAG TPA: CbtA family protein [Candidatus Tectomicrobia bacterium]|nr:CbtA family protein [Candidatus Tectomicrobia bacterium]